MDTLMKNKIPGTITEINYSRFCRNLRHLLGGDFDVHGAALDLFHDGYSASEAAGKIRELTYQTNAEQLTKGQVQGV